MGFPAQLKDKLGALLDEAYDSDGIATDRVSVASDNMLYYGSGEEPEKLPSEQLYKITVDASDPQNITIRIRPRLLPVVWPD